MNRQRGFTLIELMITIAIAAVLVAFAIPAFNNVIRDNRLITSANDVSLALNLARSEAIKRGVQVDVAATDGDWAEGITVEINGGATLRIFPPFSGGMTLEETGGLTAVGYLGTGRATTAAAFDICDSEREAETGRTVSITATGRISIATVACD